MVIQVIAGWLIVVVLACAINHWERRRSDD